MRVVLLSAPVGESHVAMARAIAAQLDWADTEIINDFGILGPALGRRLGGGYDYHLGRIQWSYNLAYRVFTRAAPARRAGELALGALGGRALAAALAERTPDLVISTHPVISTALAAVRRSGRLACPAVGVVGPLGGLAFWVAPGLDLYLLNYAEALPTVRRSAPRAEAVAIRPLVRDEFFAPPPYAVARAAVGLDGAEPVVLISGGGWGAGDLLGALDATLSLPGVRVVLVAGRNDALHHRLAERHGSDERVQILGFTERMPELLSAADAFVTATAGLSCLEARLCRCPTVCYGFPVGHVRDNTAALAFHGLARVAPTVAELPAALTAALRAGREQPADEVTARPTAAEVTRELLAFAP